MLVKATPTTVVPAEEVPLLWPKVASGAKPAPLPAAATLRLFSRGLG